MRILIGSDTLPDPNAGASGTIYQMIEGLRRLGHEVDAFWQDDMGRNIEHGNLHYLFELPSKYRREVRRRTGGKGYDVIELNQPQACAAALDHRRLKRPGVFVNRSHGHEVRSEETLDRWRRELGLADKGPVRRGASALMRRLLNRQWNRIARDADGFVVSCREDAEFLAGRYAVPEARTGVITQGISEAYLQPAPAFDPARATRLLYVAQYAFFKAPMMMARAAAAVLSERPDLTMTWVCDPAGRVQAAQLLPDALRSRVEFLAWMPQDELVKVYDRHGIFLFSSFFEGFGKTPLEAMSRGLCVVSTRTGGMRDYIDHGRNGCLVPVGDPEAMAGQVLELAGAPERCARLSEAARATAIGHTWDRCAGDAAAFYEGLLERKAASDRLLQV